MLQISSSDIGLAVIFYAVLLMNYKSTGILLLASWFKATTAITVFQTWLMPHVGAG
jgi:hypothetical protein